MSIQIKRHRTWRADLCAYLDRVSRVSFRPGNHDCALFAAGAVKAMTGVDLSQKYVGEYRSISEGMALIRAEGFESLASLVAHSFEEVPPLMASVGDLALVEGEDGQEALGVVQGPSIYVLRLDGIGRVPLEHGVRAWRVQ
jgi:hypothetical protein